MRRLIHISTATVALLAAIAERASAQTGACCRDFDGICTEGVVAADCEDFSERFIEGGTCADFGGTCGIGACCTPAGCVATGRMDCFTTAGGFFWRPGACDGLDCTDCNANARPDVLEIQISPSLDCNQNGRLDVCEIDPAGGAHGGPFFCTTGDCAVDCNNNGIPDECDIYEFTSAPGGPYFCAEGCAADCNNNGVPDLCDINASDPDGNGLVSEDALDPPGVPDECRTWTGAVNDLWTEAGNWLPPTVPNNTPTEKFSVVINGVVDSPSATVEADDSVTISSLILRDASLLTVTEGPFAIEGVDGIVNEGVLVIPEGRTMTALDTFRIRGNGGVIRLDGDDARITSATPGAMITNEVAIEGRGIIEANLRNAVVGSIDANDAGPADTSALRIAGMNTINNGALAAEVGATLQISTDVSEEPGAMATISALGATVRVGDGGDDGDDPDTVDGCGPIVLKPLDRTVFQLDRGALVNFTLWEIGDNALTAPEQTALFEVLNGSLGFVDGPVLVRNNGTLSVAASEVNAAAYHLDPGAVLRVDGESSLTVRGAFSIAGADESLVSFASGSMLIFEGGATACAGDAWERTLEAAGMNLGPDPAGGGYDDNFDFAELRLAAGANVSLVDAFDNGNRPADGNESVYCDALTIEAGATLFLNGISLFAGGAAVSPGPFGDGEVVDVEACCLSVGTCVDEIAACCAALGGAPGGVGSRCSGVPGEDCPPPPATGACCLADESCILATVAGCAGLSGVYVGDGTACADVDCSNAEPAPTGACCFGGATCELRTPGDCTASGGEYLGDGTDCDGAPCPASGPAPEPSVNALDDLFCRLIRRAVCGVPVCAPCLATLLATMIGIRRMRKRRRWIQKRSSRRG